MTTSDAIVTCENLVKIYRIDDLEVMALQGLDLTIRRGEVMALVGSSGSGKTTLLNVIGGLDRPNAGKLVVANNDLLKLTDGSLDSYRRQYVGFIWQQKARNLIPYLDVEQNIELPMIMSGVPAKQRKEWMSELIDAVKLNHRRGHKLAQLSGGEQQRVAIAIALANRPALLLGDEPTGELDSQTAEVVFNIFHELNRRYALTVIIVSHDPHIAHFVNRVVAIRDGKTSSETVKRADSDTTSRSAADLEELHMLDSAGRLQIPKELRERYGIRDRLVMEEQDEGIFLKPPEHSAADAMDAAREKRLMEADAPPELKTSYFDRMMSSLRRRIK
jgi:ABC-type lipoprotein export system ATPase subunit/bifunctional DNA-binding transcriptional regulator/antitoxin component of YhaV-PrlF toxin-antitoxin module